jgi:hypothetical protein
MVWRFAMLLMLCSWNIDSVLPAAEPPVSICTLSRDFAAFVETR